MLLVYCMIIYSTHSVAVVVVVVVVVSGGGGIVPDHEMT